MLHGHQDVFLVLHVVNLFEANHLSDRHHFKREVFPRWSMPRKNNASERSRSLTKQSNRRYHTSPALCNHTAHFVATN